MPRNSGPVFAAILKRRSSFLGFGRLAWAAGAVYSVLVAVGLSLAGAANRAPSRKLDPLVVTLLDVPERPADPATGTAEQGVAMPNVETSLVEKPAPDVAAKALKKTRKKRVSVRSKKRVKTPKPEVAVPTVKPEMPADEPKSESALNTVQKNVGQVQAPAVLDPPKAVPSTGVAVAATAGGEAARGGGHRKSTGPGQPGASPAGGRPARRGGASRALPFTDKMTRPKLLSTAAPVYSREAREARVEGLVLAKCVITTVGRLERCRIMKGYPLMNRSVLKAFSKWRYTPVVYQGKPVNVDYLIRVRLVAP